MKNEEHFRKRFLINSFWDTHYFREALRRCRISSMSSRGLGFNVAPLSARLALVDHLYNSERAITNVLLYEYLLCLVGGFGNIV